jgi:hypothetical protein
MAAAIPLARARAARLLACAAALVALAVAWPAAADAAPIHWCAPDLRNTDRGPDSSAGAQIHVVYAYPSDGTDRTRELAGGIVGEVAAVDAWWRREDPARSPRWDSTTFPGCDSTWGNLDITTIKLAHPAAYYAQDNPNEFGGSAYEDLVPAPLGSHPFKKYLVYYDGAYANTLFCGVSFESINLFFALLQAPTPGCPVQDIGQGTYAVRTAAHELIHNLGAVRSQAPHLCEEGHVCDSHEDLMDGRRLGNGPLSALHLDVGHDDYYAHSGTWFDVQDSPYLARVGAPLHELRVSVGEGGTVASEMPGIGCPGYCVSRWEAGTKVVLHAQPGQGQGLKRWGGACVTHLRSCTVTMDGPKTVSAEFATGAAGTGTTRRNYAPRARIGRLTRSSYEVGETVTFSAAASDRDGTITKLDWSFGDGTTGSGLSVTHVYKRAARFAVALTATDDQGAQGTSSRTINVTQQPPRARAFGRFARPGERVQLNYTASDNTAVTRVRIEIVRGKRRLLRKNVAVSPVRFYFGKLQWRAPRRAGELSWCVRSWDVVANVSERDCAPVHVR